MPGSIHDSTVTHHNKGNDMSKERDYLFDNIKGYLIISVITAHFFRVSGYFAAGTPSRFIYIISFTYIMQGFLFVSGYFSKNVDKCRAGAFKNFIIPYVIFVYLLPKNCCRTGKT